jgi:hypothetical protein
VRVQDNFKALTLELANSTDNVSRYVSDELMGKFSALLADSKGAA